MQTIKEKLENIYPTLKEKFNWTNKMQATKLEKVAVNVGTGRVRKDKAKIELIIDRLNKITGQKPSPRIAKKSIAAFKLREGEIVGYKVTLRGKMMRDFTYKFINLSLPRMKDFQGVNNSSVDDMGNLSIGIKEHIIFPEIKDENLQDIFSLSIIFVSSAKTKEEGIAFFKGLGFLFKK